MHRVAKTHRIPDLYKSFTAKEPYKQWLFCKKMTCNFRHPMGLRHHVFIDCLCKRSYLLSIVGTCAISCVLKCVRTPTHTHTQTNTHTHTRIHMFMSIYIYMYVYMISTCQLRLKMIVQYVINCQVRHQLRAQAYEQVNSYTHTHASTHTRTNLLIHPHTYTHIYKMSTRRLCVRMGVQHVNSGHSIVQLHAYAFECQHTHTHNKHTHTQTNICICTQNNMYIKYLPADFVCKWAYSMSTGVMHESSCVLTSVSVSTNTHTHTHAHAHIYTYTYRCIHVYTYSHIHKISTRRLHLQMGIQHVNSSHVHVQLCAQMYSRLL